MIYPTINSSSNPSVKINGFFGLNRRDFASAGEFSDMENLSSDKYPYMTPRLPRKKQVINENIKNISAFIAPQYKGSIDGFTGVADGVFYYRNEPVEFFDESMQISGEKISLADFNGKIIIAPQMYYFDYTSTDERLVKNMKTGITDNKKTVSVTSSKNSDDTYTNYISSVDISDWGIYFNVGDSVFWEGFDGADEINNLKSISSKFITAETNRGISAIVEKIDANKLYVKIYSKSGAEVCFMEGDNPANDLSADILIYKPIPNINSICVHNNRLWGTDQNGEFIYASKVGDPFNFNCFEGLSTDSWYSEIGTKGEFVGICSYRDNIVAFKDNYIHHVYGDKPSNYSIPKQLEGCGCIDIKSVCQIGTELYYLGYKGFYAYFGGQPQIISDNLNKKYVSATAITDGVKYYVSAKTDTKATEFLVYTPKYRVWHKEDNLEITGGAIWGADMYVTSKNSMFSLNCGEEKVSWSATLSPFTENTFMQKGINDIFIRGEVLKGASVSVYTSFDNGEFILWNTTEKEGFYVWRIPVRFKKSDSYKIMIKGVGDVLIHGIERVVYAGGKSYSKQKGVDTWQ